jgi:hypothetical protein
MSNLDESVTNDGMRKSKNTKPMTQREKRIRYGDALKPLKPGEQPKRNQRPPS